MLVFLNFYFDAEISKEENFLLTVNSRNGYQENLALDISCLETEIMSLTLCIIVISFIHLASMVCDI